MSGAPYTPAGLLFALEAVGVTVSLNPAGDGLTLTGVGRPPADLLEAVRTMKPDLLVHLESSEEAKGAHILRTPGQGVHSLDTLPPHPDWAVIGAQPGRCGSCARAVNASSEWGEFMVTCSCEPVAWWPTSPPLAVHVGAQCGAYLMPGEEVGRGWRAKDDGKAWGPLRPVPLDVSLSDGLLDADHEGAA